MKVGGKCRQQNHLDGIVSEYVDEVQNELEFSGDPTTEEKNGNN